MAGEQCVDEVAYKRMDTGAYRIAIPVDKFPQFVTRVLLFIPDLVVGSVQYRPSDKTPINFMIEAVPRTEEDPKKMEALLQEYGAVDMKVVEELFEWEKQDLS